MKTKKWAMGLVFLSTICAATGQILIKIGLNSLVPDLFDMGRLYELFMAAFPMLFGYGLYGFSAAMLIVSLKYGELSTLYPIYAMNFVWVAILSPFIFPQADIMNPGKWFGVLFIVVGVAAIGFGSKGDKR